MGQAKKSFSKEKYQEKIRETLGMAIRSEFSDPMVQFISVTRVELSPEFDVAKVYWDTFNSEQKDKCSSAVKRMVGRLRTHLSKNLKLKHTPELRFIYDSQFEDEARIDELLKNERS